MSTAQAEETQDRLSFGLDRGHPTAWGARAILHYQKSVDLLWDRQGNRGPRFDELAQKLNAGPLEAALKVGRDLHPEKEVPDKELYRGGGVVVIGNTNASHGYIYLGAWLEDDE